ncbi:MAG: winged helix DNA-binding protein [Stappiaceae bacterium]
MSDETDMASEAGELPDVGPIVSAAHLASGAMPALSEMEFAMTMMVNAYHRWTVRGMAGAGIDGLSPLDVQILHSVNHRARQKSLADLCLVLNIEDTHTVTYALRKLEKAGLIKSGRRGKEKTAKITAAGEKACLRYRAIREALLVSPLSQLGLDEKELSRLSAVVRTLSGQYDQAARSAAAL